MAKGMLHEAVSIQMSELWPRGCYMIPCVDRDLKCDEQYVT